MAAFTTFVVTLNVTDEAPAGTFTVAGTVALREFDLRLTKYPFAPAAALNVTAPVHAVPPATLDGDNVREETPTGNTVSNAVWLSPPYVALTVAVSAAVTDKSETANVAVWAPPANFTDAGTVAARTFELLIETVAPVAGAAAASVIVPVTRLFDPPITEIADRARSCTKSGLMDNDVDFAAVPNLAVIVAEAAEATLAV